MLSASAAVVSCAAFAWAAGCGNSSSGTQAGSGSSGSSTSGSASGASGSGSGAGASGSTTSGDSSSGAVGDASIFTPSCTASAANLTLVDNETGANTQITLAAPFSPMSCGAHGGWFNFATNSATITPTPFAFSPLPAGIPAEAGVPEVDATVADAAGTDASSSVEASSSDDAASSDDASSAADAAGPADAEADGEAGPTGPQAACMSGVTATAQFSTSGMGFNFVQVNNPDGGAALPATLDASAHTGIQFWAWGGDDLGAQSIFVVLKDINQTSGFGAPGTPTKTGQLCNGGTDGNGVAPNACGGDRVAQTVANGWQLIQIPFTSFLPISGYDTANGETKLDPSTLTQFQLQVQEPSADAGTGVSFDICLYGIAFY